MKHFSVGQWSCGLASRFVLLSWLLFLWGCTTHQRLRFSDYPIDGPNLELMQLADELFQRERWEDAQQMYARAVSANGPNHAYVESCAQVARIAYMDGNTSEARIWIDLGRRRATEDDPLGWSRVQLVMGILEAGEEEAEIALQRFKDLYAYCMSNNLHVRALGAAHQVVSTTPIADEKVEWSQKGMEAAESGGMYSWLGELWNRKGETLAVERRWSEALIAFQQAKGYFDQASDRNRKFAADWEISRALREAGELDRARSLAEENLYIAQERYARKATPFNSKWLGFCLWEVVELGILEGDSNAVGESLLAVREKLIEGQVGEQGERGRSEMARIEARLFEFGVLTE